MRIYQNLYARTETYFVRTGSDGCYATGVKVMRDRRNWLVDFSTRFLISELTGDREHFPVVGDVDVESVIADAVLKAVKEAEHE